MTGRARRQQRRRARVGYSRLTRLCVTLNARRSKLLREFVARYRGTSGRLELSYVMRVHEDVRRIDEQIARTGVRP